MSGIKTGWCSDNNYPHVLGLEQDTPLKTPFLQEVCSLYVLNFMNKLTLRAALVLNKC